MPDLDVRKKVRVVGPDEYRLDGSDNDGWGCESHGRPSLALVDEADEAMGYTRDKAAVGYVELARTRRAGSATAGEGGLGLAELLTGRQTAGSAQYEWDEVATLPIGVVLQPVRPVIRR